MALSGEREWQPQGGSRLQMQRFFEPNKEVCRWINQNSEQLKEVLFFGKTRVATPGKALQPLAL